MAAEDNIREKERMIEQKQQREVKLQRGREEEARPAKEDSPFFFKVVRSVRELVESTRVHCPPTSYGEPKATEFFLCTASATDKKRHQRHTLPRAQ